MSKYSYQLKPLPSGAVSATYDVDEKGMVTIDVTARPHFDEPHGEIKTWQLVMSEDTLQKLTWYEITGKEAIDAGLIKVTRGDLATAWHAALYVATHTEKKDIATGQVVPGISMAELERIARARYRGCPEAGLLDEVFRLPRERMESLTREFSVQPPIVLNNAQKQILGGAKIAEGRVADNDNEVALVS